MTLLQNKLDNILVMLDRLVFHGLPYDDEHVKAFRDVCDVYQYGEDRKIHGFVVKGRHTVYQDMKFKRGNTNYKYDPFCIIHEIHSGYKNAAMDMTVRKIASYLETFMYLYTEEMMGLITAQLRIHADTIGALKIRSTDTEGVGLASEAAHDTVLTRLNNI
jgi:hypothetical protein